VINYIKIAAPGIDLSLEKSLFYPATNYLITHLEQDLSERIMRGGAWNGINYWRMLVLQFGDSQLLTMQEPGFPHKNQNPTPTCPVLPTISIHIQQWVVWGWRKSDHLE